MSNLAWKQKDCGADFGHELWLRNKRFAWTFVGKSGWCWCAPSDDRRGIKWRNSYAEGREFSSPEAAMSDAKSYIAGCLRLSDKDAANKGGENG